jgi:ABC-type molybdate transport system permease subunit
MIALILLVLVAIISFSSYFIANKVYKSLQKGNNDSAMLWSVLTFILCFGVLAVTTFLLIMYNIRIER